MTVQRSVDAHAQASEHDHPDDAERQQYKDNKHMYRERGRASMRGCVGRGCSTQSLHHVVL